MAWHERGGASSKVTAQTRAFTRDLRHHPAYRPDVDGLRALAIIPVVLFHAFPTMLRGGFVGVDIFFVISGFLISGIIFKALQRESFSFPGFYANRIKRSAVFGRSRAPAQRSIGTSPNPSSVSASEEAAWITSTIDQYVETAVTLANQAELLARYRTLFTQSNWAATIGDIATFTYHYEESLIQIENALHDRDSRDLEANIEIMPERVLAEAAAA